MKTEDAVKMEPATTDGVDTDAVVTDGVTMEAATTDLPTSGTPPATMEAVNTLASPASTVAVPTSPVAVPADDGVADTFEHSPQTSMGMFEPLRAAVSMDLSDSEASSSEWSDCETQLAEWNVAVAAEAPPEETQPAPEAACGVPWNAVTQPAPEASIRECTDCETQLAERNAAEAAEAQPAAEAPVESPKEAKSQAAGAAGTAGHPLGQPAAEAAKAPVATETASHLQAQPSVEVAPEAVKPMDATCRSPSKSRKRQADDEHLGQPANKCAALEDNLSPVTSDCYDIYIEESPSADAKAHGAESMIEALLLAGLDLEVLAGDVVQDACAKVSMPAASMPTASMPIAAAGETAKAPVATEAATAPVAIAAAGEDAMSEMIGRLGSVEAAKAKLASVAASHVAPTSYTHHTEFQRFKRQVRSTMRPLDSILIERFATDKMSLFEDWLEAGEKWAVVKVWEERRQTQQRDSKRVWRMLSRADLLKKYNFDEELVRDIIESKVEKKLYTANEDCPQRQDQWLYFCLDHTEVTDLQQNTISQGIRVEAPVNADTVGELVNPQTGQFADTAPPLRSGLSSAVWSTAMTDLNPGVKPIPCPPIATMSAPEPPVAPKAPAPTFMHTLPKAQHNHIAFALSQAGIDPNVLVGTGVAAALQAPPAAKPGKAAAKKTNAAKSKAKAKACESQSALVRGKALRQACLADSSKCHDVMMQLKGFEGCEGLADTLNKHQQEFDKLFSQCNDLINQSDDNAVAWDPIVGAAEAHKKTVKTTIDVATDCIRGLQKRMKAGKEGK